MPAAALQRERSLRPAGLIEIGGLPGRSRHQRRSTPSRGRSLDGRAAGELVTRSFALYRRLPRCRRISIVPAQPPPPDSPRPWLMITAALCAPRLGSWTTHHDELPPTGRTSCWRERRSARRECRTTLSTPIAAISTRSPMTPERAPPASGPVASASVHEPGRRYHTPARQCALRRQRRRAGQVRREPPQHLSRDDERPAGGLRLRRAARRASRTRRIVNVGVVVHARGRVPALRASTIASRRPRSGRADPLARYRPARRSVPDAAAGRWRSPRPRALPLADCARSDVLRQSSVHEASAMITALIVYSSMSPCDT